MRTIIRYMEYRTCRILNTYSHPLHEIIKYMDSSIICDNLLYVIIKQM